MPAMEQGKEKDQPKKPAAAGAGSRKTVDKWKKKKWFTIAAPGLFDKRTLGETPAEKPKNMVGRTMVVTLDMLTGQRARREYSVCLKIFDVQGQNASTKVSWFAVNKGSLGRTIRRRNSKVALIEKIPVIGGYARTTVAVVTNRKATKSQQRAIRALIKQECAGLANKEFETIVKELLLGQFTTELSKKATKICQIKKVIVSKSTFEETK